MLSRHFKVYYLTLTTKTAYKTRIIENVEFLAITNANSTKLYLANLRLLAKTTINTIQAQFLEVEIEALNKENKRCAIVPAIRDRQTNLYLKYT